MFEKVIKILEYLIEKIENAPIGFSLGTVTFLSIIAVRILVESWVGSLTNKTAGYFFHHIAYTFVFFLFSFLIFLNLLQRFFKISLRKASNIMLVGYLIIIFPPLIDYILLNDKIYLSFYGIYGLPEMARRFITFFGDNPDFGITYGVRVEIALTIFFLFVYSYIKTKRKLRSLILMLLSYTILFILATFPSWITILWKGSAVGFLRVGEIQIAQMFLTPARFFSRGTGSYFNALSIKLSAVYSLLIVISAFGLIFYNFRRKFLLFLKNIRLTQVVYHCGLLLIGMAVGIKFTDISWRFDFFNLIALLNIIMAVVLMWISSLAINDIFDKKIDVISNKDRPLILGEFSQKEYVGIALTTFFFAILFSAIINPKVMFLLVAYQALAWIYSAPPLRLKRFAPTALLISSLASVAIFVSGFVLVSPKQDISILPTRILWLLFISLILSLSVKDLKDIAGDKKAGIKTIPVVFGEYWGKVIVGAGIFLSYVLSVIFLNEFRLFLWAIVLGGISFWLVVSAGQTKKITKRNIIVWLLAIVVVYVLIMARYIFFA